MSVLKQNDAEALWNNLFDLIAKHSAVRSLYSPGRMSRERLLDTYADLTQDLFLRLYEKSRWQHYLDQNYTDEAIEHELYHIEVPNFVSHLLRERYPESYRIVRRVSALLQTRKEFRHYPQVAVRGGSRPCRKLGLRVFGLSWWPPDKPLRDEQNMLELIREVPFRSRDTRRTGRGSGSQIIISNHELTRLIVDIFTAIDSPADVRTIRTLTLSRLAVEDSRFVSIDAGMRDGDAEPEGVRVELTDERPTPEQALLHKETLWHVNQLADELLGMMNNAVKRKPNRFRKLVEVVWHCYFNEASPSQTTIARMMRISGSLVSHYRKIFDALVQTFSLDASEWIVLNQALSKRLQAILCEMAAVPAAARRRQPAPNVVEMRHAYRAAAAGGFAVSADASRRVAKAASFS